MGANGATTRLHLLRHAKSSWADAALADHERPLAPRGRKAAARMARWIERHELRPELVLCSSAVRARETLALVERALGSPRSAIEDDLYHASAGGLLDRLRALPDEIREVLLVGHNPGLAELCLLLARPDAARERVATNLPTGALATLELEAARWADIVPATATLAHLVLPRELGRGQGTR